VTVGEKAGITTSPGEAVGEAAGPPAGPPERPTRVRHGVVAALCAAAALAYVHRSALAVPANLIQHDLGLTVTQVGWVMSCFYLTYALFQIPSGWFTDRWGTRRVLAASAAVWSVATGVMGFATGFPLLFLSRALNGVAQAGAFPCSVKTLAQWFPPRGRAFPTGLLGSFQSVGAALATVLVTALLPYLTWQSVFFVLSLPGVAWAVWFYIWFRDRPGDHPGVNAAELRLLREGRGEAEGADPPRTPTPWVAILLSPTLGLLCGQQFFRAAGYVFYQSWFPTYLQQTRGVSLEDAGYLSSLPLLAFVLGLPFGGGLVDWVLRRTGSRRLSRQVSGLACMLACGAFILLAHFVADARAAVLLIAAGSFCVGLGGPTAYVLTMDLGGRHVATVFSTMNTAGNVGAAVCPVVVARLVDWSGSWHGVLLFFSGVYAASALCWLFLDPNRPILASQDDPWTASTPGGRG
jgi:sugar phosphate permease